MNRNRPSAPLFATINVTGVCNLKCSYCFFQPRLEKHMPLDAFIRIVNELVHDNVFFINISGGEPFMHPQISEMLKYAHQKFFHVVLLTNGTLIRESHINTISDILEQKGTFPIQISLDSIDNQINKETRCSARRILKNIRRLANIGANIMVAMVITKHNANTIINTIKDLSNEVSHFHIMAVQPVRALNGSDSDLPLGKEQLTHLWEEIKQVRDQLGLSIETPLDDHYETGTACGAPCMAAFSQVVIDPDLRVRPCDRCVNTYLGDLSDQTLSSVWNSQNSEFVINSDIPFCQQDDLYLTQALRLKSIPSIPV